MSLLTSLLTPSGGTPASRFNASMMENFGAGPSYANGAGTPVWLLDGAATESVITTDIVPTGKTLMTVTVYWIQWAVGTTGEDVDLRLRWSAFGDGEILPGVTTASTVTTTIPDLNKGRESTIVASDLPVTAGDLVTLIVDRIGADDTFTSDIGISAIVVDYS